jgi:hypothetical protein
VSFSKKFINSFETQPIEHFVSIDEGMSDRPKSYRFEQFQSTNQANLVPNAKPQVCE